MSIAKSLTPALLGGAFGAGFIITMGVTGACIGGFIAATGAVVSGRKVHNDTGADIAISTFMSLGLSIGTMGSGALLHYHFNKSSADNDKNKTEAMHTPEIQSTLPAKTFNASPRFVS